MNAELPLGMPRQPAELHETVGIYRFDAKTVASDGHPERDEDALLVDTARPAIGVFDGVQSATGSELAANLGVEASCNILYTAPSIASPQAACNYMHSALLHADQKIRQQPEDIAATAVVLKLFTTTEGQPFAAVAWAGDSRCYRLRDGTLEVLTFDHNLASEYATSRDQKFEYQEILSNIETQEQFDRLPAKLQEAFNRRYDIKSWLGGGSEGTPTISTAAFPVLPGDKYIVMCDGVSDNLTTEQIRAFALTENAPDALISYAQVVSRQNRFRSHVDDMTVGTITVLA